MKFVTPLAVLAVVSLSLAFAGCDEDDSPQEEAAEERFEESAGELGESLKETGRDLADTADAAGERAGHAIDDGSEEVGEALEGAGEDLQDDDDDVPAPRPTNPD